MFVCAFEKRLIRVPRWFGLPVALRPRFSSSNICCVVIVASARDISVLGFANLEARDEASDRMD